jgi:hypothetical protein
MRVRTPLLERLNSASACSAVSPPVFRMFMGYR